jgi:hypothetical protein
VPLLWRHRQRGALVTDQGLIGRDCAWCGLPAVADLEIQPAQYRAVSRRDPMMCKRTAQQQLVRSVIVLAVCDTHEHIKRGQPASTPIPRQRTAHDLDQLGMFPVTTDEQLRNAIRNETG